MMLGLKQRIGQAKTSEEIQTLLSEGQNFEYASKKTRNSWRHTAERVKQSWNKTQAPSMAPLAEVVVSDSPKPKKTPYNKPKKS